MGAGRLLSHPKQRGDSSSISTQSTQELSLSSELHENHLRQRNVVNTSGDQEPSPRTSQLFLPHLNQNVESSLWPSKFTATMYIIVSISLALRNHRVLYAIFLGFHFQMIKVIMKWRSFVFDDLQARMARSCSTNRPNARLAFLIGIVFSTIVEHETTLRRERRVATAA